MPKLTEKRARIAIAFLLAGVFFMLAWADAFTDYSVRLFVYLGPLLIMLALLGKEINAPWFSTGGDDE